MSMKNNPTQPNAAPKNNVRELNLIDNLVGDDVHDDVENSDIPNNSVKNPDTQLKLGSSRIEKSKDPVFEPNLTETIASVEAGDEGCSKWNERLMIVSSEDLVMSPKSDDDLVEGCHITPTAALELVVENEMADAPEIGALRKSPRPRKPNPRLKGYQLYDPKKGYYLNE